MKNKITSLAIVPPQAGRRRALSVKRKMSLLLVALMCQLSSFAQFQNGDLQWPGLDLAGWTNNGAWEYNTCQATTTNEWVDLTGTGWGNGYSIEQNVPTVPGKWYVLKFDLATFSAHYFCDAGTDVSIDGVVTHHTHTNFASISGRLEWRSFTRCFQATGTSTNIKFTGNAVPTSMSPPGFFAVGVIGLDNVELESREISITASAPCWNGSDIELSIDNWGEVSEWAEEWNINWEHNGNIIAYGTHAITISGPGQYIVHVSSDCGDITDTIEIEDCCETCKPDISWSNLCYRDPATFNISRPENCADYMSDAFTIDYGDGNTASGNFDASLNHTYAAGGAYTVKVCWTACDIEKCTTFVVQISCVCPCEAQADFDWKVNCLNVQFNNHSSGGNILCQYWDFGDGSTSTDQNPNHTYAAPGTYHVCLTIFSMGPNGCCCATICKDVVVKGCGENPCDIDIGIDHQMELILDDKGNVIRGHIVMHLIYGAPVTVISEVWTITDLGNGSTMPGGPVVDLPPGRYRICVTVTFRVGDVECRKTICFEIEVPSTPGDVTPEGRTGKAGDKLGVDPNPTTGLVKLTGIPANTAYVSYELTGSNGTEHKRSYVPNPGKEIEINLENLPAGIYFLHVHSAGFDKRFKVIRQ